MNRTSQIEIAKSICLGFYRPHDIECKDHCELVDSCVKHQYDILSNLYTKMEEERLEEERKLLRANTVENPYATSYFTNNLQHKHFCLTGLLSQPRENFIGIIRRHGGVYHANLNGSVQYLLIGDLKHKTKKMVEAEKRGVKIIEEDYFKDLLRGILTE